MRSSATISARRSTGWCSSVLGPTRAAASSFSCRFAETRAKPGRFAGSLLAGIAIRSPQLNSGLPVPKCACRSIGLDPIDLARDAGPRYYGRMVAAVVSEGLQQDARHHVVQVVDDRPDLPPTFAFRAQAQVTSLKVPRVQAIGRWAS